MDLLLFWYNIQLSILLFVSIYRSRMINNWKIYQVYLYWLKMQYFRKIERSSQKIYRSFSFLLILTKVSRQNFHSCWKSYFSISSSYAFNDTKNIYSKFINLFHFINLFILIFLLSIDSVEGIKSIISETT